jgi:hypothetical protein
MLGEKIGESTGQSVPPRVLHVPGGFPKMEISSRGAGKLLGIDTTENITYEVTMRADGTVYGQGVGLVMGKGGEAAQLEGHGVGTLKPGGGVSWRGAFFYHSTASAWKRLNAVAVVFEAEIDAAGNSKVTQFEWR